MASRRIEVPKLQGWKIWIQKRVGVPVLLVLARLVETVLFRIVSSADVLRWRVGNPKSLRRKALRLAGVAQEVYHVPIEEIDKRILESVEAVAAVDDERLNGTGKNGATPKIGIVTIAALERRLIRQLVVDLLVTQYQEIQETKAANPLVIVGAPRTGTTILLELLGLDTLNWRQLKSHEATLPIAGTTGATRAAHGWLAGLEYVLDGVRHIHHERWDGPTECRSALENGVGAPYVLWYVLGATASLDLWLTQKERRFSDYGFYRQQLEVLSALQSTENNTSQTWLLKDPMHTFSLDALLHAFPQATIVWTHRSPEKVVASMCSLLSSVWSRTLRQSHDTHYTKKRFDSAVLYYLALALDRAVSFRAENTQAAHRFLDVSMNDLVQNPMAVIDQIYAFNNKSLAPHIRAKMIDFLELDRARKQAKKHAYHLSDFDLNLQDIQHKFSKYTSASFFPSSAS